MFMFKYVITPLNADKNKILNIRHGKQHEIKRKMLSGFNFMKSFTEETEGNGCHER